MLRQITSIPSIGADDHEPSSVRRNDYGSICTKCQCVCAEMQRDRKLKRPSYQRRLYHRPCERAMASAGQDFGDIARRAEREPRRDLQGSRRALELREKRISAERPSEHPVGGRVSACYPFKPGRNGLAGLAQRIEIHSPLALVILLLGTNDFQSMHQHNVWHSAQGLGALVTAIRQAPIEPGMPVPPILVVAPPAIETPKGTIHPALACLACSSMATAALESRVTALCATPEGGAIATPEGQVLDALIADALR
jgi:hypothetical protein